MLPIALTRYFADSLLTVISYDANGETLTIRIEKEIGSETGVITFGHVSFMLLSSTMLGEVIRARPVKEAGPDFWSRCRLERDWFDQDDIVFELESQDGPAYFVVAKMVDYEIRP